MDDGNEARGAGERMRETMTEPLRAAAGKIQAQAQEAASSTRTINTKVLDHAEQNVSEAFNALRAAASAGSVAEVMKVQTEYVQAQAGRSMNQAREIGELIASFGQSALKGMTGR